MTTLEGVRVKCKQDPVLEGPNHSLLLERHRQEENVNERRQHREIKSVDMLEVPHGETL